jgi:4-aminobutyrate aminotransferase/(S)-3-amino-2-methylpropionate transaminase
MSFISLRTTIPGPKSSAILERRKNAMPAGLAKSTEVVIDHADGGIVYDVDGNSLLDFAGGIGMLNVGHRKSASSECNERATGKVHSHLHTGCDA